MGFEIDFLPVGDGERSGDAIAVRWGNLTSYPRRQTVMVIDGGTLDSGERLVEHVRTVYKTDTVDLALSTHPDGDHASGLEVVLQELRVGQLWMHRPWEHSADIRHMFDDGTLSNDRLSEKMKRALTDAWDLEKLAKKKGIPIVEPFSDGQANSVFPGTVLVLGPTTDYYQQLLPGFRDLPDVREDVHAFLRNSLGAVARFGAAVAERVRQVQEHWGWETLKNPADDATSSENNSSAIVLLRLDGQDLLFTGDAGVPALNRAVGFATRLGISLKNATFQQVPHHGSKRNVGPTLLDRLVGPKLAAPGTPTKTVFISAAKEGMPKHPAKAVINAYIRRGASVLATQGGKLLFPHDAPPRTGYGPASPFGLFPEVEED